VLTSPAAAALRDVLTTLARRNPAIPVIVYPVPVQGEGAAARIAAMLATANARDECDVLLLVRGGGSIEDLWSFNEEQVAARAARLAHPPWWLASATRATSPLPTSPPTGVRLRPRRRPARQRVARRAARAARRLRAAAWDVKCAAGLEYAMQNTDSLARRLVPPGERLRSHRQLVTQLLARLAFSVSQRIHRCSALLERFQATLASIDPTACSRAATASRDAAGEVIRDAAVVKGGEVVRTTLARGWLESEVRKHRIYNPPWVTGFPKSPRAPVMRAKPGSATARACPRTARACGALGDIDELNSALGVLLAEELPAGAAAMRWAKSSTTCSTSAAS